MNIIVVDDEFAALNVFLSNIVDNRGINFTMFHKDPYGAVEYVRNNNVDAAFLDINIAEVNGIELAKSLIKVNEKIKIVFISGYAQNIKKIKKEIGDNLVGFCPKPYAKTELDEYFRLIESGLNRSREIRFITFGGFDVLLDGEAIQFRSTKSKELLAYLVYKNGITVTMDMIISMLWPEKNVELAKRLYRDAVVRLRLLLTELELPIVTFGRGSAKLELSDNMTCDEWEFSADVNNLNYNYEYLPDYDWSIDKQSALDVVFEKRLERKA